MNWHVQYIQGNDDQVETHCSPEAAIEAARRLIDDGCDVFGIGTGPLSEAIDRGLIDRIYEIWARTARSFRLRSRKRPLSLLAPEEPTMG
jgi:hypothetical protein